MSMNDGEVLTLAPGGGWLCGGETWVPPGPFYGVIGDPIEHSLSPVMQSAALRTRDLSTQYMPIRIRRGQLRRLRAEGWSPALAGFNVTAPLKEEAAALCAGRTDVAREVGVVNTVRVEGERWLGHNTDSGGILSVLTTAWLAEEVPHRATVLGAGGSARAAVHALLRWGVRRIVVKNRSQAGRRSFDGWLEGCQWLPEDSQVEVAALGDTEPEAEEVPAVWIVCLAGGVSTRSLLPDVAPMPPALLVDLRYGEALPVEAPPLGMQLIDGKPILLMQGGLSFAWWFGPPIPWDEMRAALEA